MKKIIPMPLKRYLKGRPPNNIKTKNQTDEQSLDKEKEQISASLAFNFDYIKNTLGNSSDIVTRKFELGKNDKHTIGILYTDGLSDHNFFQDFILETLLVDIHTEDLNSDSNSASTIYENVKSKSLPIANLQEVIDYHKLYFYLLSGDTILLIDGFPKAIAISSKSWAERGVQEPTTQTVVRGPKDGFSETLRTNTALIRRRIKDTNLWLETKQIGKKTKTDVAVMYLKDIVTDSIVQEVHQRLDNINVDSILESGYIEELIQGNAYSPFPTVFNTERPDVVAAALLEGRVAIFVDGTPFVLIVPALFTHFFQASEDYYHRADISSFIRLLRYLSFFLVILTPAAFIAVTTFHQEMLPTRMLISLAAQREGVPLPAIVEAIMMEITFELLREAGIRMPRAVGSAISIVGALVIGQAAVEAGIVSASMVIVVSLTAISSFVSPSFNMSISARLIRFPLMLLAASFGMFGIMLGLIIMVLHLTSLKSFGIPYMAPNAPFNLNDQKDNLIRLPRPLFKTRPRFINQKNINRSGPSQNSPSSGD